MSAGYPVHAAKETLSMDIAFRVDYSFKGKASLAAEYSWRHLSDYYAGTLYQAGFRLWLVIGPSH